MKRVTIEELANRVAELVGRVEELELKVSAMEFDNRDMAYGSLEETITYNNYPYCKE